MQYLITFLEGVVSFLSPCMLPLLPAYVGYFAAGADRRRHTLARSLMVVAGFTLIFCLLGVTAGSLGSVLAGHRRVVEIVCGVCVILFGLAYLDVIPLPFFRGVQRMGEEGLWGAFVFGMIYALGLTPCVGAFLGSALMLASASGTALRGTLLLMTYALGLGVPFLVSAMLLEKLRGAFGWIKAHYTVINRVCGLFLIVVGVLMATGVLSSVLKFFV